MDRRPVGGWIQLRRFHRLVLLLAGTDGSGRNKVRGAQLRLTEEHAGGRRQDPLRGGKELVGPGKRLSGVRGKDPERLGEGERVHLLRAATDGGGLVGDPGSGENPRRRGFNFAYHRSRRSESAPQYEGF